MRFSKRVVLFLCFRSKPYKSMQGGQAAIGKQRFGFGFGNPLLVETLGLRLKICPYQSYSPDCDQTSFLSKRIELVGEAEHKDGIAQII